MVLYLQSPRAPEVPSHRSPNALMVLGVRVRDTPVLKKSDLLCLQGLRALGAALSSMEPQSRLIRIGQNFRVIDISVPAHQWSSIDNQGQVSFPCKTISRQAED